MSSVAEAIQRFVEPLIGDGLLVRLSPSSFDDFQAVIADPRQFETKLRVRPEALPLAAGAVGAVVGEAGRLVEAGDAVLLELHRVLGPEGVLVVWGGRERGGWAEEIEDRLRRTFPHVATLNVSPSSCWTFSLSAEGWPEGAPVVRWLSGDTVDDETEPDAVLLVASRRPRRLNAPSHLLLPPEPYGPRPRTRSGGGDEELDRLRREVIRLRREMIGALRRGDDLLDEAAALADELERTRRESEASEREREAGRTQARELLHRVAEVERDRDRLGRALVEVQAERDRLGAELEAHRERALAAEASDCLWRERQRELRSEVAALIRRRWHLSSLMHRLLSWQAATGGGQSGPIRSA